MILTFERPVTPFLINHLTQFIYNFDRYDFLSGSLHSFPFTSNLNIIIEVNSISNLSPSTLNISKILLIEPQIDSYYLY
jgi:hypothetical protein